MMRRKPEPPAEPTPELRAAAVAFLQDWLPEQSKATYRELIREDPTGWMHHPHFADGFFVRQVLRGNGLDEKALGVRDLEPLWPALLEAAVFADAAPAAERRSTG